MKKWLVPVLISLVLPLISAAQKNPYFQQTAGYKIQAELFPETKLLKGQLEFTYTNNSPDVLPEIWFHLYPNAFKNETTPFAKQMVQMKRWDFSLSKPEEKGWMTAEFSQNGSVLATEFKKDAIDEIKVTLQKPLKPGETVQLSVSFETRFPKVFSRIGYEKNNFSGTQWYPKVVVYDGKGWHPDSYLDYGEFYGEYGSWDVTLTLPKRFVIDATGILYQSPHEAAFMDSLASVLDGYYAIQGAEAKKEFRTKFLEEVEKNRDFSAKKTVRYKAENVQDFAWFASESFLVRKETGVDQVLSYALIQPDNWDGWKDAARYAVDAVKYYSSWVGAYPHPKASVVDGSLQAGGGMEYPMITVISMENVKGMVLLDQVVTHEVGHNFFQGIIGSNERAHGWMDEGINSFYEIRTLNAKYGKERSFISDPDSLGWGGMEDFFRPVGSSELYTWLLHGLMWRDLDQTNNVPAQEHIWNGNATITYYKTAMMMFALKYYLGDDRFDRAMQSYFSKWKFKHPYPEDFYSAISESAGEDLNWFFEQWNNTRKVNDFVISGITTEKTPEGFKTTILPENKGEMVTAVPVFLILENGDTLIGKWDPKKSESVSFSHQAEVKKAGINLTNEIYELDYTNNTGWPEYKFNFLFGIPALTGYDVNLFPVVSYESRKDHFQLGGGFYSGNPVQGKNLQFGTVYYGISSESWGYRYHYKNRIPRFLLSYVDYGFTLFDQEGFKRQEIYTRAVHNHRFYSSSAELSAARLTTYNLDYMNKSIYQKAAYTVLGLKLKAANSSREYASNWQGTASKSVKVKDSDFDFTRLESAFYYRYNFSPEWKLSFRNYFGVLTGTVPVQEHIFAGGTADPGRYQIGLPRSGGFGVLAGFSDGTGMDMTGYGTSGKSAILKGKAGWSNKVSLQVPGNFVLFADAGNVYKNLDSFDAGDLIYDAGIGFKIGPLQLSVPFWVSDPFEGEKNTEFRAHLTLNLVNEILSPFVD